MTPNPMLLHHLASPPFSSQCFYGCHSCKSSNDVADDDQLQGMSSSLPALERWPILLTAYVDVLFYGVLEPIQKRDQHVTPKGGSISINLPQIEGLSLHGNTCIYWPTC